MLPGVESGEVGAVHRTRVASRRLRELLPVLQLESNKSRKLGRRLKKLSRRLGDLRELDVLVLLLDQLRASRRAPPAAVRRMIESVRTERNAARSRLTDREVTGDLKRAGKKLQRTLELLEDADRKPQHRKAWHWAVDARVARRAAALKHAIHEAGSMYVPDRVHQVRLAIKKLRYGVELANDAAGVKTATTVRQLERWQDHLGRLRDFQVLIERVRRVQASMERPTLDATRELDDLVLALESSCRRLHARFLRDRAAIVALCDRLGARASPAAARRAS
jgi:CHAD domain-containing protein